MSRINGFKNVFNMHRPVFAVAALLSILWVLLFFPSLKSAFIIWYGSEIFNHCLFVLPGAMYLVYRQRQRLSQVVVRQNYWIGAPLFGSFVLYALGLAGDVQLFMHLATFVSLPLLVWMLFGNQVARTIAFPLLFILFAIPVGEELIPLLQDITATSAVTILEWSGIPVFRSGLYIDVPGGKFLVAEACSGISFFISTIVIGCLYAHLNISNLPKKIGFLVLSVFYPIIANAIRVYGIILIAYLSDMKYAAGADHLIYGGVFFGIIIISLLFIGELFRDKTEAATQTGLSQPAIDNQINSIIKPALVLSALMVSFYLWYIAISQSLQYQAITQTSVKLPSTAEVFTQQELENTDWLPSYQDPEVNIRGRLLESRNDKAVDFYLAYFVAGKGELISNLNRLYLEQDWTVIRRGQISLDTADGTQQVTFEVISNPYGRIRYLASWFVLGNQTFADKSRAKLYQIYQILFEGHANGGLVALSSQVDSDNEVAYQRFISQLSEAYVPLTNALPQGQDISAEPVALGRNQ